MGILLLRCPRSLRHMHLMVILNRPQNRNPQHNRISESLPEQKSKGTNWLSMNLADIEPPPTSFTTLAKHFRKQQVDGEHVVLFKPTVHIESARVSAWCGGYFPHLKCKTSGFYPQSINQPAFLNQSSDWASLWTAPHPFLWVAMWKFLLH